MRRIYVFLSLLFVVTFFVQNTHAAYLPDSSYQNGDWSGYTPLSEGSDIYIDYSVYDRDGPALSSDENAFFDAINITDADKYIYAYQIYTMGSLVEAIASFEVLDKQGNSFSPDADINNTGSLDDGGVDGDGDGEADGNGGIPPEELYGQGRWMFDDLSLIGFAHSYFLFFSSDSAPVMGTYDIQTYPASDFIYVPGSTNPEPTSILLFGASGLFALFKRKTSVKRVGR